MQPFDCDGSLGDDLVVDLEVYRDGELRPCEACLRAYMENSSLSLTAQHTSAADLSMVVFGNVAPGLAVVTARDRASGRTVARRQIEVQAGRLHALSLMPLTASE
jgi:hypothetical protein